MSRTRLQDVPLGNSVRIHITKDGTLSESNWCRETIAATVLGRSDSCRGIVLIGWKRNEWDPLLTRFNCLYGRDYSYDVPDFVRDHRDYTYVRDIQDYYRLRAYSNHWKVASVEECVKTIHSTRQGPFQFIRASGVLPGDTITWAENNTISSWYGIVDDVAEGEDINEQPAVVLHMNMYNHLGMVRRRSEGVCFKPDRIMLLLNRAKNTP